MPSPARFAVVRKMLEAAGYTLVRVTGSHHIFTREGSPLVSIPVHKKKVKPFYVRQIEKLLAEEEREDEPDDDDSNRGASAGGPVPSDPAPGGP